jgi:hypothetical protein
MEPARSLVLNFRGKGYGFSAASIYIFMAALLSLFAAVYAFWIVPLKQNVGSWHFWLTTVGLCLFWASYYSFSSVASNVRLKESTGMITAVALGWLTSVIVVTIAQGIFIANLISAILRLRHRT